MFGLFSIYRIIRIFKILKPCQNISKFLKFRSNLEMKVIWKNFFDIIKATFFSDSDCCKIATFNFDNEIIGITVFRFLFQQIMHILTRHLYSQRPTDLPKTRPGLLGQYHIKITDFPSKAEILAFQIFSANLFLLLSVINQHLFQYKT